MREWPRKWHGIGIGLAGIGIGFARIGSDWTIDKLSFFFLRLAHGLAWVDKDWPGISTGFVKIGIDWKGLGPVPIT